MAYVIVGGDGRFEHLARLLKDRGERVETVGGADELEAALSAAENVVVNCPPKVNGAAPDFGDILAGARPDARVFACGPGHPAVGDGRVIDLWADEALILENAALTAEGAVAAAMGASEVALRNARCLVVGWGRIGRALTELLVGMGAGVAVASRSPAGRNRAVERGAKAVATADIASALPGRGIVFNTAPSLVLDAAALRRADRDALLIDLASPPYGIDLAAAWALGLRAWREPGLPGRYCPGSAARALLEAISRRGL